MASTLRKNPLAWAAAVAGLSMSLGLVAQQAHAADDLSTSPYLFGDWNGARTRLADDGVTFNFGYGGEAAHNFSGGDAHLTRYTDQWVLGAGFDLGKLWGWNGATFQITVTDRNGRNLGADAHIGNNQLIQEVYGRGQTWHLTQFWLKQAFFDGKLTWKFGRATVGEDFASFSCDFENLTFCGSQPGNIVGNYWVNWPTSQWATVLRLNTTNQTYMQIGAYQVNPNYINENQTSNGIKLNNPGGTTGALIPVEFGWTPSVDGLAGSYKIGGWYNNSKSADVRLNTDRDLLALAGGDPLQHAAAYGGYINFMQQITGADAGHGASLFLNISQADKATAATDRQISVGMEYKAPFNRPNDMIGVAYGLNHLNGRSAAYQELYNPDNLTSSNGGNEIVSEVFYSWSPIPSIFLRPNLQYIVHPGGTTQNDNAFVLGLKTGFTF
jgi:porin